MFMIIIKLLFFLNCLTKADTIQYICCEKKTDHKKRYSEEPFTWKQILLLFQGNQINLVENSIRYSADGKTIFVKLVIENDHILFSVEDERIGIPPYLHSKVLEPYFQINHVKKSSQGLGLACLLSKKRWTAWPVKWQLIAIPRCLFGTRITNQTSASPTSNGRNLFQPLSPQSKCLPDQYKLCLLDSAFEHTKPTVLNCGGQLWNGELFKT